MQLFNSYQPLARIIEDYHIGPKYKVVNLKPEEVVMRSQAIVNNGANRLNQYINDVWPQLVGMKGVWIVGSTAWLVAGGADPHGAHDLDLVCSSEEIVDQIVDKFPYNDKFPRGAMCKTYLGGTRMYRKDKQIDLWALTPEQTIEDMVNGFTSHPHARVYYEVATKKLTVLPNEGI